MKSLKLIVLLGLITLLVGNVSSLWAINYEELAYHWSPLIYQDVDSKWETEIRDKPSNLDRDDSGIPENGIDDFITRFDFDGDFVGDNNWENLSEFEIKGLPAFIYYSVAETQTHWFVFYAIYHPRDWDDEWTEKINGKLQHENDLEGLMIAVRRDGTEFGSIQTVNTFAHNHWFNYPVSNSGIRIREGFDEDRAGQDRPRFVGGSHVVVYVQAEGHGIFADKIRSTTKFWQTADVFQPDIDYWERGFPNETGICYIVGSKAETAWPIIEGGRSIYDQLVSYELLDISELWLR